MTESILLWGLEDDPPLGAVREQLATLNARVAFIDQRLAAKSVLQLGESVPITGTAIIGKTRIDLSAVQSAYLRPYDVTQLPQIEKAGPSSELWRRALAFESLLLSWAEETPAFILNRPTAMAANNSKPYQLAQIAKFFAVPDTLITTDSDSASHFWKQHGTIIYKSLSGVRSRVQQLSQEHRSRLRNLRWCPTQFQQYIAGTDYRVHIVGMEIFAVEVCSTAHDYRYPETWSAYPTLRRCKLPLDVEDRCRSLTESLSFQLAGLDLRRSRSGTWFCFEVNPSPAFTSFNWDADQQIAKAIARLLASSRHRTEY